MKRRRGTYLIRASVREMAADQVVGHIGRDRYETIKAGDPHPFFFGSSVAQTGISTGSIEGKGAAVKHWPPAAVAKLAQRMNESPAPVFLGHGGSDRPRYGTVVSGIAENGEALAVGYIEGSTGSNKAVADRVRAGELDTNSIEADLVLQVNEDGSLVVEDVEAVTGLALGDSRFNKPGFAGARVLVAVQEFEDDEKDKNHNQEEPVKLSEITAAIREGGFRPDQVFDKDSLLAADPVKSALEAERKTATEAQAKITALTTERDAAKKTSDELSGKLAGYESKTVIGERIKAAKLTEKTAQYVEKQLADFVPQGASEEERQQAVDAAVKKQADTFKEFFSGQPPAGQGEPAASGAPGAGLPVADPSDFSSAEVNPFIPGSTAKVG